VAVSFEIDSVPGPGAATVGRFSGTVQKTQAQIGQTILLGVAGCWDGTLAAEDG
jgi:hypothetical protein